VQLSEDLPQIHVQPGESQLLREPGILSTLLGSCVGVTFWARRLRIGALCHPMLPAFPARVSPQHGAAQAGRYVDFAIRSVASQLDALGVARREIEVKLFGGADVLDLNRGSLSPTVGKLNREAALRTLGTEGFHVAAYKLGGNVGMQIHFNTSNGEVLLRQLGNSRKLKHPNRTGSGFSRGKQWK
jgi:chemotaxis protein CheD